MKVRKKIYSGPRKSLLQKKDNLMQIKAKDEANLKNDSDILRECNSFYLDLYTTKSTKISKLLEKTFFGYEHHKLNEMDKKKCKGLFY